MDRKLVRLVALGAMLTLVAVLGVGCAKKTEAPTTPTADTPKSDLKVGLCLDTAGLGDKSFNDAADAGLKKAKGEFGIETKVLSSKAQEDYETNLVQLANGGYSLIFANGFLMVDVVSKVAATYPDVQFAGIDCFFEKPAANVVGLNFNEQEGTYLAGVLAGLATTDKTVSDKINDDVVIGFVGGMDVPLIRKFQAGYEAGAKSVNPNVKIIALYTGSWADQAKGKELGLQLISQGADIIFAAAGGCGIGTIKACQEKGALFIGVDQDQYITISGSGDVMLTSVVKRVDSAVYGAVKAKEDGNLKLGENKFFGLKDEGMSLAPYHDFDSKIPQSIKDAVETAKQGIIDGTITVPTEVAK